MKGFVRNRGGVKQPNGSYKGGSWTAYWEDGTSADGRRRQGSKGGFAVKREAQVYLSNVLGSKQTGMYVPPVKTSFGNYLIDSWLPIQQQRLRASSLDDYRRRIKTHIIPALGGIALQDLDAARLDRFYADLLDHGGPGGRSLAPKTVRNVHVVIRKALADATRKRLVSRNVAIDADPPKVPGPGEREMATWTPEELKTFLSAIASHRLAAAYVLAASTGMRRGEVLGLRWSDLDLDLRTLAVVQTIVNVAYKITISEPKTARGRRTISLDAATVAVLRTHRSQQLKEKATLDGRYDDHDLVFACPDGQPVHPDFFSQTFERAVKRLGLRRVRLHDLRHIVPAKSSCRDWLMEALSAAGLWLGHPRVVFGGWLRSAAHACHLDVVLLPRFRVVGHRAAAIDPRGDAGFDRRRSGVRGRAAVTALYDGGESVAA